ncbi:ankyrin repeat domain-containing protein [Streptomyces sp. NPDC089799]|uniref:ankyrin repeat domain-containing protein n=1 Tax=Streptomyces sp. NPDC089799 TaxID=3155066 RepID=UPI0034419908
MSERVPVGGPSRQDAVALQTVRRYAVPRRMIEEATARRLAGDWRGACDSAAVDVLFDPEDVAHRHGTGTAALLADDLRHLAPDLLRWHAPRLRGHSTLEPGRVVLLARYGPRGPGPAPAGPYLYARTPNTAQGPQRIRLCFGTVDTDAWRHARAEVPAEHWTAARFLWDARHSAGLRASAAAGGPGDRLPFFAPDGRPLRTEELPAQDPGPADPVARAEWSAVLLSGGARDEAWAAAGVDDHGDHGNGIGPACTPGWLLSWLPADVTRLVPEVIRLAAAGVADRFALHPWTGRYAVLEPVGDKVRMTTLTGSPDGLPDGVVMLPGYAWSRLPDPALVRAGLVPPRELHPLVAAALFPAAGPASGPPGPPPPAPVRVRCGREWHEIGHRDGALHLPHEDEPPTGDGTGCHAVRRTWTTDRGRLPRALQAQRQDLFLRAGHGDTHGVLALLDAGFDPRAHGAGGRSLLHVLHLLDHEPLLPRLLAAGLDPEARDKLGRTPLLAAVHGGGSADLVRALLAAGCRIDVVDDSGMSLAQMITRYRRTDLDFLAARLAAECPGIGSRAWDWANERLVTHPTREG